MKFKEYLGTEMNNKGLAELLFSVDYARICDVPNKRPLFDFCERIGVQKSRLICFGSIHMIEPDDLPDSYCLKPADACTARGLYLMQGLTNLKTGKVYGSFEEVRAEYLEDSLKSIGYSEDCSVEDLVLTKGGDLPEDFCFFMIKNRVGCILQDKKFGASKGKAFYDCDWNLISSEGATLKRPSKKGMKALVSTAKKVMSNLDVPCLRVDLLYTPSDVSLCELTVVSGIPGTLSDSFKKMSHGRELDKYLGYLFIEALRLDNPFRSFDAIYVISKKGCDDRRAQFIKQAAEYEISFKFFDAIEHDVGSYGCSLSHDAVIREAKAAGHKDVLVFEDDAYFMYSKEYVWIQLKKALEIKCDVLYLGSIMAWNGESEVIPLDDHEVVYKSVLGRHALCYRESSFDSLINSMPTYDEFMASRDVRGDVLLAKSPLIKKGPFPLVTVNCTHSHTGTNAMTLKTPLPSGEDHLKLICSAYISKDLLHYRILRPEVKAEIFKPAVHYGKRVRELLLMGNPFRFIGGVKFINLSSDVDRRNNMLKLFEKYNIPAERFNAIKNENGWAGSTLSHRKCVEIAKHRQMDNILIFEDDVDFFLSPEETKKQLMSALVDIHKEDYEILYLGSVLTSPSARVGDHLFQVQRAWGLFSYLIDSSAYDTFLGLLPTNPNKISQKAKTVSDVLVYWHMQPKGKCFITPLCISVDNYSHNWKKSRTGLPQKIITLYDKYLTNNSRKVSAAVAPGYFKFSDISFYVINMPCELRRYMTFYSRVGKDLPELTHITPVSLTDPKLLELVKRDGRAPGLERKKETSIRLSFVKCFKDALDRGLENIIIFEDDSLPCYNIWKHQIETTVSFLPKDYGICFLGGYFMKLPPKGFKSRQESIAELLNERSYNVIGSHAVLYNKRVFKDMITCLSAQERNITETVLCRMIVPKYCSFAARPSIFRQNETIINDHGTSLHGRQDFRSMTKISSMNLMK